MHAPRLRLPVTYCYIDAALLEHALTLLKHYAGVQVGIVPAKYCIDRRFVDRYVEIIIWVFQVATVHDFIDHVLPLPVPELHLVYDDGGDVNVV